MGGYAKRPISSLAIWELAEMYGAEPGRDGRCWCAYCGALGEIWWARTRRDDRPVARPIFSLEIDHVVPEKLGGQPTADNLVAACRSCNRTKSTKSWDVRFPPGVVAWHA